jgi:hypothetical protein
MFGDFRNDRPLGYQQITSLVAATALTVPAGAIVALISCAGQPVRWRDDGTNPTAAIGYPLAVGAELEYTGQLNTIKFIETTATANLDICYYGFPL